MVSEYLYIFVWGHLFLWKNVCKYTRPLVTAKLRIFFTSHGRMRDILKTFKNCNNILLIYKNCYRYQFSGFESNLFTKVLRTFDLHEAWPNITE